MFRHSLGCVRVVFVWMCALVASHGNLAHAQEEVWQPLGSGMNDAVIAVTVYNGELIAAGQFTIADGFGTGHIARWNGASWQRLGEWGMDNVVRSLTVYNGELIAGGYFTTAGGIEANGIARWNGSSWQSLGGGVSGGWFSAVHALTVYNGELIAGGQFTTAGGIEANGIARWNGSSWQSLGGGVSGVSGDSASAVYALTVMNGELIAGGEFTTAGGVEANGIARWDGSSWQPLGSGVSNTVWALTVYNGELIAGGYLIIFGEVTTNMIARWDGSSWQPLGAGLSNTEGNVGAVSAFGFYNGELIVGGSFLAAGEHSVGNIARWNGSTWLPSLGTGMNGSVQALTVYNGELIAGGQFATAGGQEVYGIARTTANSISTSNCSSWRACGTGVSLSENIFAVTAFNGYVIAGGRFSSIGGVPANNIAQWNGSTWEPLGAGIGGDVSALDVFNGELIVGGTFTTAGEVNANCIARWNGSTWNTLGSGFSGGYQGYSSVESLTVYNGQLIASGNFTIAGGLPAKSIARWNGAAWQRLGAGLNHWLPEWFVPRALDLDVYNGELIAAGTFDSAGGNPANGIARWNGSTWQPVGIGSTSGLVWAVTAYNDELFASGDFSFGGVTHIVARWNGSIWQPVGTGLGDYQVARALIVYQGELVAGGGFHTAWGAPGNYIARWNGSSWQPFINGPSGEVRDLALSGNELIVSGRFMTAGGVLASQIGRWSANKWANPISSPFSNPTSWEWGFDERSPTSFGNIASSTPFTVTFPVPAQSSSLCITNQRPIFDLDGNTYQMAEYTTIGAAQTAQLTVNNGTLISPIVSIGTFGTLCGDGTIIGDIENVGTVCMGDGSDVRGGARAGSTLTVLGNYEQQTSATLLAEIRSDDNTALAVQGEAMLAGKLVVEIPHGEQPDGTYQVLIADSMNPQQSRFDLVYATGLPAGKIALVDYGAVRGAAYDSGRGAGGGTGVNIIITDINSNLNLEDPSVSSIDGVASAAVLADFNSDAYLDLAVTLPGLDGVAILLNEGGVGDTYTQLPLVNVGNAPADLIAAQLDAGTSIDLAVANEASDSVSILVNDGRGNFKVIQTVPGVGDAPVAIVAANIDGVNGIDLAVANRIDSTVRLLMNDLARDFALGGVLSTGSLPVDLAALQLGSNAGGLPDLVVVCMGSKLLQTFTNNGAGTLNFSQSIHVGSQPVRIHPEDLDGDKDLDLIVANSSATSGGITMMLGLGNGVVGSPVHLPLNGPVDSLTSADIDGDSDADLAVIMHDAVEGRVVRLIRNDTSEQTSPGQIALSLQPDLIGAGTNPLIVLSGDINNDEQDDLVTINGEVTTRERGSRGEGGMGGGNGGSVRVQLRPAPRPICLADLSPAPKGDGQVNLEDIQSVIAAFNQPCDGCAQDIAPQPDGDGQVSIADINAVLAAFGPCP